jgi:hypothetical protein
MKLSQIVLYTSEICYTETFFHVVSLKVTLFNNPVDSILLVQHEQRTLKDIVCPQQHKNCQKSKRF